MVNLGTTTTRWQKSDKNHRGLKNIGLFAIFNIIPSVLLQIHLLAAINYFKSFHNYSNISENLSIYEKKYSKVRFLVNNSNNDNTMPNISSNK